MTSAPTNRSPEVDGMTVRHQCDLILSILCDVVEQDVADHLGKWFDHVGFDPTSLRHNEDLMQAWLGHYKRGRRYDVDRALNDLLSWPPIADRIAMSPKEKNEKPDESRRNSDAKKLPYDLGNLADDL